jgi:hypothetical protein
MAEITINNLASEAGGDKDHFTILEKDKFLSAVQEAYEKGLLEGRNESPLYAVIPVSILERTDISANAKLLYAEIMALSKKSGKCYATNKHLASMLGLKERSITQLLNELSGTGIVIVSIKRSSEGTYRDMRVSFFDEGGHQSIARGGIVRERGQKRYKQIDINKKTITKVIEKPSYGNEDINELVKFLEVEIGGSLDGTQKENRQYCHLLLGRFKKDYPIQALIRGALTDSFHSKNIAGFKYLYYNAQKIIMSLKNKKQNIIKIS